MKERIFKPTLYLSSYQGVGGFVRRLIVRESIGLPRVAQATLQEILVTGNNTLSHDKLQQLLFFDDAYAYIQPISNKQFIVPSKDASVLLENFSAVPIEALPAVAGMYGIGPVHWYTSISKITITFLEQTRFVIKQGSSSVSL